VHQQLARVAGDAVPVVGPPQFDLAADVIDQRVLFAPLAGEVEVKRLLIGDLALP